MSASIPQTDPRANYLAHQSEIDAAIGKVLANGRYILGPEVAAFEQEFAAYIGTAHAVGVANGTDALHLALRACGIGPGDRVITVSHTAVATAAAIELAGATPVFVDIDPSTYTMDPAALGVALDQTSATPIRAVVPVHLYGHPADMPTISDLAARYGLKVIEDCAQSHGANIAGRRTGTWGHAAAFSFYPTKNLGALGDGGAVVTGDPEIAERVRLLREYGWRERYISESSGMNSRLDELQAAILRVKLRNLDAGNARRREIAAAYEQGLAQTGLALPTSSPAVNHAWHQYVVRSPRRDELRYKLSQQGVGTLVHYPVPVHLQPAYQDLARVSLPHTEAAAKEVLSLPLYPELAAEGMRTVVSQVLRLES